MSIIPRTDLFSLKLIGSVGEFAIGENDKTGIFFIETTISPGAGGTNDFLLNNLAPVRELFEIEKLDFSNLVQRDLNDARVSNQLIPYLIKEDGIPFKFFPPILAVAMPFNNGRMVDHYNDRENEITAQCEGYIYQNQMRLGKFKENELLGYLDYKPNTMQFAIIDGQHRAMAILALYRNLCGNWNDKGKAFENYYSRWSKENLENINLENIKLPVCICVFTDLFKDNVTADRNIISGSRKLFLDVNKHARKVSESTQILLDDETLTNIFTRDILSRIKNTTTGKVKVYNVLYDGSTEKYSSALPATTITSVIHVNNLINQILLGKNNEFDMVSSGSMTFKNNSRLSKTLDLKEKFGGNSNNYKNDLFPYEHLDEIIEIAANKIANDVIYFFENFIPFTFHYMATEKLRETYIRAAAEYAFVTKLLFEGQGVRSVFDEQISYFKEEQVIPPAMKLMKENFSKDKDRLDKAEKEIQFMKLSEWTGIDLKEVNEENEIIFRKFSNIFNHSLTSQAFLMGFFMAYQQLKNLDAEFSDDFFQKYFNAFNDYFKIERSIEGLSKDIRHKAKVQKSLYILDKESEFSLLKFCLAGRSMDPKLWPIYSYLALEIVEEKIKELRNELISERLISLLNDYRNAFLRLEIERSEEQFKTDNLIHELTDDQKLEISTNVKARMQKCLEMCLEKNITL